MDVDQTPRMANLRVGAKSHTGNVRTENQDRMGRFPSPFGELCIVVDGMGGHKGGATAAAMTVDRLEAHLRSISQSVGPQQALEIAARMTNAEIYQKANDGDPETANMGATLVLVLVVGSRLIVAHAGDSRAYLFRDGRLTRLTRDHSVVQRMIDHNILTEEQARDHPDSSVITRAFGQRPDIELEVSAPFDLKEGDGILLCTDGLCGYADDPTIERAISEQTDAQQITDALIELALRVGGEDNVTVQFLQFGERRKRRAVITQEIEGRPIAHEPSQHNSQNIKMWAIIAGAVVAGLIALYLAGLIPGFGPSTSSINENVRGNANQNHRGQPARGASQGSSRPEREVNSNANAQTVEARPEGEQGPAPTAGQNDASGSISASNPGNRERMPVAVALSPHAGAPETTQRNFAELEAGNSRVLVILSALWIDPKGKSIFYRDDYFKQEAEKIRVRLGYAKDRLKPMTDKLASDFQDYDIIIHP